MGAVTDLVNDASSPQAAIKALAIGIDQVLELLAERPEKRDAWDAIEWAEPTKWDSHEAHVEAYKEFSKQPALVVVGDEESSELVFAGPTPERKEARRQFEQQHLHLSENLGTEEDWTEVYALGGPLWFYHGNRELFMSYPYGTRAAMVQEVEQDDPQAAHEMARDVLKQPCEDGPGGIAMGTDEQVKPHQRIYAS